MFIKRFFNLFLLATIISGCTQMQPDWNAQYGTLPAGKPGNIQQSVYFPEYGMYLDQTDTYAPKTGVKTAAVLLPLTGENANLGDGIAKAVQLAFLQKNYKNISISFIDTGKDIDTAVDTALTKNPDIIIGPVFSKNTKELAHSKPFDLPVLSFSSDPEVIGGGIMTFALLPTQSVEAIVNEIKSDNTKRLLILAPDDQSGKIMASAALSSADLYDVQIAGLQYYTPGDQDSIKEISKYVSMFDARSSANTRAREILSDALINEKLTNKQKSSLNTQLDKISKLETLGDVPYDAVLLLGNAPDSKALTSFLRYYNVGIRDVKLYGTALWDSPEILRDFSMSGAKFAGMPEISESFVQLYENTYKKKPNQIDSFGFDAANMAIGMMLSEKPSGAYLLDPSGYKATSGLIRLMPSGENTRALQIMKLNGTENAKLVKSAVDDFIKPIYGLKIKDLYNPDSIELTGSGINPNDYINLPETIAYKYTSKTYGANMRAPEKKEPVTEAIILPEDDSEVITNDKFKPTNLETIDRKFIDSVEVEE